MQDLFFIKLFPDTIYYFSHNIAVIFNIIDHAFHLHF